MVESDHASTTEPDAIAALLRRRLSHAAVEIPVAGTSMSGVIASGSTVVLSPATHPRCGEIWAFVDDDGGVVVHRVREYDGSSVTARGTGNRVDDDPVPASRLVGRVVESHWSGQRRRFGSVDRVRAAVTLRTRRRVRRLLAVASRRRRPDRNPKDT
ncbi:MAG: S24/S26 family peptidase [Acidimicrobiales bacterium]